MSGRYGLWNADSSEVYLSRKLRRRWIFPSRP